MAGVINEKYTWTPTVKIGTAARQSARVRVWDNDGDSAVNLLTGADGKITEQELVQAIHDVTGTGTTTNQETPHKVRTQYIGDTDLDSPNGKYATFPDEFSKDLGQVASLNTIFLDVNPFVTHTKTVIAAYTGIAWTHASDLLTITVARTVNELYEAAIDENYDNPQYTPAQFIATTDGLNYNFFYDLVISSAALTGGGKTLVFDTGKDITFTGTASLSGLLSVNGDVSWDSSVTSISGLTVIGGALDFTTAGTYNLTDCIINEVTNSSGGAVIINALGSTVITTNTGPNITINNSKSFTFTLQPSITGYEWRIYNVTALGSLTGAVEQDGEESATVDNQTYVYNYTADQPIAVQIIPQPDEDFVESITYYTLSSSDQSVNITLTRDTNN